MNTDDAWERWGAEDPYYGVLTHPRFRASQLDDAAREEFFASGRQHVQFVLDTIRHRLEPLYTPQRVLDFGCGVGRVLMPFAVCSQEAVGLDVSRSMLEEARANIERAALQNAELMLCDDSLSCLAGHFDLVHSYIVLQHIEVERGLALFERLVGRVADGGFGAIHVAYASALHHSTRGRAPASIAAPEASVARRPWWRPGGVSAAAAPPAAAEVSDPPMQMNAYPLNELGFVLQSSGVRRFHVEFTDHGGALGAFFFFRKKD